MNIKINAFDSASINAAIAELKKYSKSLKGKAKALTEQLADRGVEMAQSDFNSAPYDGARDVTVTKTEMATGHRVTATGETALFIEFGAGVHYPDSHPEAGRFGMIHGTYGQGKGKNDYWFYTGQPDNAGGVLVNGRSNTTITHGNPPSMTMYNTEKDLVEQIGEVAKEIFDD